MWYDRPRPMSDGLVGAIVGGLGLCVILSLRSAGDVKASPASECQEVVVTVERQGNVLAHCPPGTYIDILESEVVCRCGFSVGSENSPPPATQNPEPPPKPDDKGETWL